MTTLQHFPPELLSGILELVCRGSPAQETDYVAHTLAQVSKLWRAIIFSTPSIWTVFHIGNAYNKGPFGRKLERSGDLPLDISIVDESSRFGAAKAQLQDISIKSHRWQHLRISHPDAALILEQVVPQALPGVRTLSVKATPRQSSTPLRDYYPFLPDYPTPPTFSLTWTDLEMINLRNLELSDIILKPKNMVAFLDFLQACPNLQSLSLSHLWESDANDPSRSATLQSLRSLELRGITSSTILRWIVAPNLHRLLVERVAQARTWSLVDIESHYATAKDVTLIRFSTIPAALRNILRAVPLVSDLKLLEYDFSSPASLSAENVLQEQALPCLTDLHIQGAFSLHQVEKAVEVHQSTLKTLEVHCLDLGLSKTSLERDYEERDKAWTWLKSQSWLTSRVSHGAKVIGDRYWSHQDRKDYRQMDCIAGSCRYHL